MHIDKVSTGFYLTTSNTQVYMYCISLKLTNKPAWYLRLIVCKKRVDKMSPCITFRNDCKSLTREQKDRKKWFC